MHGYPLAPRDNTPLSRAAKTSHPQLCTPKPTLPLLAVSRDELDAYDAFDEGVYCRARFWLLSAYIISVGAILGSVIVMLHYYGLAEGEPELSPCRRAYIHTYTAFPSFVCKTPHAFAMLMAFWLVNACCLLSQHYTFSLNVELD